MIHGPHMYKQLNFSHGPHDKHLGRSWGLGRFQNTIGICDPVGFIIGPSSAIAEKCQSGVSWDQGFKIDVLLDLHFNTVPFHLWGSIHRAQPKGPKAIPDPFTPLVDHGPDLSFDTRSIL